MDRGRLEAIKQPSIIISVTKTCHLVKNLHHFKQSASSPGQGIDWGESSTLLARPGQKLKINKQLPGNSCLSSSTQDFKLRKISISTTYSHDIDKN